MAPEISIILHIYMKLGINGVLEVADFEFDVES